MRRQKSFVLAPARGGPAESRLDDMTTRPPRLLTHALAAIGRRGGAASLAVIALGIALPALGRLCVPLVPAGVLGLLAISVMRTDPARVRALVRRPGLVVLAVAWSAVAMPVLLVGAARLAGLDARRHELFVALVLQGAAPPMMSTPAFAALLGLDADLVLVCMLACMAAAPLVAPWLAHAFLGGALAIEPAALGGRLAAITGLAVAAGLALRHAVGAAAVERGRDALSGLNVLLLVVVVGAMMKDVAAQALAAPPATAVALAAAVAGFALAFASTALAFRGAGPARAPALALMAAQRNLGVMAAAAGALPPAAWLYFGLSQVPIYLAPGLLRAWLRRAAAARAAAGS
jgi:BASS family bile acid:Na+ symporter